MESNNLKNELVLRKVFNILDKKKSLDIVKYNKNLRKRINININDYKEYSEKYSSIEIEIKPVNKIFGNFINLRKKDKKYVHTYFDRNEEEIKRNFTYENEEIKIIEIIIDHQIETFEDLFYNCKSIESIYFKKFCRTNINNMRYMCYGCSSLKELNLKNFNTNNVVDMAGMFNGCSLLKELNINNFNTNNVIDMSFMFYECPLLKELNLYNFNTSNVIDMSYLFYGCSSLKELYLNNFNINNVANMDGMFYGCSKELIMKIKTKYKNIKEEAFVKLNK